MKSKISFFNSGILFNDLKRFSWIWVSYLAALIFMVPLEILMNIDRFYRDMTPGSSFDPVRDYNPIIDLFRFESGDKLLMYAVPVITAIFLFRYMQSKDSGDMYHSLPVKRSTLFNSKIILGILFLTVPLLITGAMCIAMRHTLGIYEFYSINAVLNWMNINILMNIIIFMGSVFFGMITGSSITQGVLTYIFLFIPVGLSALLSFNMMIFVNGFNADYYISDRIIKFSPLTKIADLSSSSSHFLISMNEIIIYIILCALFYLGALLIYRIRNIESYTQIISFRLLEPIFIYGVTFCTMLLGGAYFYERTSSRPWTIFGYTAIALLGYLISLMLIKKSFYIFKSQNMRGFVAFAGAMAVIAGLIHVDVTGFESRIPDTSNIKRVYFARGVHYYLDAKGTPEESRYFFTENANIERISALHREVISDSEISNPFSPKGEDYESINFIYELENGSKLVRCYDIPKEKYYAYFKSIYESFEYKKMNYDVFTVDISKIKEIEISPNDGGLKGVSLISPEEISAFVALAKKDITESSYEQLENKLGCSSYVDISKSGSHDRKVYYRGFSITPEFKNVRSWLDKKGYTEKAILTPSNIKYIVVEERKGDSYSIDENESIKRLEINEPDKIQTCINTYASLNSGSNNKYIVGVYTNDGSSFYKSFDDKNTPEFVNTYFEK